jgi:hypothetical protein
MVEHLLLSNTEDFGSQLQPGVSDTSSPKDLITPPATTSSQWQGSMYPVHVSDPSGPSDGPFARFEFLEWLPSNAVDSVSQPEPNVLDPSSHIQDPTPPPATTSSQWQGIIYPVHASDNFRDAPVTRDHPFRHFEFPEVCLL